MAMRSDWGREAVAELRSAVYRGDGHDVVRALRERAPDPVLQLGGEGLLSAVVQRVGGAEQLAASCVGLLRERAGCGDEELAEELEAALAGKEVPGRQPVPVDLDELAGCLEGDPLYGSGRLDVESGEIRHHSIDNPFEEQEEVEEYDPDRWLWIDCEGSHDGYRDMVAFAATVEDQRLAELLDVALDGKGAFRRFKDVLGRDPDELQRWFVFSDDRQRGRARSWLAAHGYRPAIRTDVAPP